MTKYIHKFQYRRPEDTSRLWTIGVVSTNPDHNQVVTSAWRMLPDNVEKMTYVAETHYLRGFDD